MQKNHAIIIGASSGIGLRVAKRLKAEGWKVAVAARRVDVLRANFPDDEAFGIDVNQSDAPSVLQEYIEAHGVPDLFFYAAGVGKQNPELAPDVETATVETNALGFTRIIDTVFNRMATHGGGHIAVISSVAGTKGLAQAPSYSATKAFQNTYIEALQQLSNKRKLNIALTDIRPGFVDTPLLSGTRYPMLMNADRVASIIVKALKKKPAVMTVDCRWRFVVALWRLIPHALWRKMKVGY